MKKVITRKKNGKIQTILIDKNDKRTVTLSDNKETIDPHGIDTVTAT